jgi:hypothetical protein
MHLEKFCVATFNLFNMQVPGKKMNRRQQPWTDKQFIDKVNWTVFQLVTLGLPDIVGLQELWSKTALDKVMTAGEEDEHQLKHTYDMLAKPATGGKIICGALVRKGLLTGEPTWVDEFPDEVVLRSEKDPDDPQAPGISVTIDKFSRPVLNFQVKLRDDLPPTEVFVVHLKSKLPTALDKEAWFKEKPETYKPHAEALGAGISTIRRTAEAVALRVLLNSKMKDSDTPVIVLGDINDGQHSNTANILTAQPNFLVGGSVGGKDIGLYTAQTLQEYRDTRDVYYTHVHQDLRESLDHVLVSEQFYDNSRRRQWVFDGLVINNDHLNFDNHKETGTGDHGVVGVKFKHRPFR